MEGAGVAVVGVSSHGYGCEDAIALIGHQHGTCHHLACMHDSSDAHGETENTCGRVFKAAFDMWVQHLRQRGTQAMQDIQGGLCDAGKPAAA